MTDCLPNLSCDFVRSQSFQCRTSLQKGPSHSSDCRRTCGRLLHSAPSPRPWSWSQPAAPSTQRPLTQTKVARANSTHSLGSLRAKMTCNMMRSVPLGPAYAMLTAGCCLPMIACFHASRGSCPCFSQVGSGLEMARRCDFQCLGLSITCCCVNLSSAPDQNRPAFLKGQQQSASMHKEDNTRRTLCAKLKTLTSRASWTPATVHCLLRGP